MFILPLITGHYSVYIHVYIIHNNLIYFCCLYVSSQAVELLIYNLWSFRHVTPVKTHLLEIGIHSTKFHFTNPLQECNYS